MKETCVDTPVGSHAKCGPGQTRWNRPFFATLLLFTSLSFTLIPYFAFCHNTPGATKINKFTFVNLIVPSILEYIGQTMFMIGMLYIPMSLSLTLKGARVVFSAILVVLFLKRKLFPFHWFAVITTVFGLVIAALPYLLKPSGKSTTESLIGMVLIIGGEFFRSMKGVVEEKLMKKLKYHPMLVVGVQGLYGICFTIPTLFIVNSVAGPKGGAMEDLSVTLAQFSGSALVIGLALTFPLTAPALFTAGAYVTKYMSAVHNALTGILTNSLVWILTIIIHYIDTTRGSPLEWMSLVQLLGFSLVLVASLMYDSILRIPQIFSYPLDRAQASGAGTSEKSVLGLTNGSQDTVSLSTTTEDEVNVEEGIVKVSDNGAK